jgi:DNA-directed RNA polymerase subunit M/transcription elongation factor TFIIS
MEFCEKCGSRMNLTKEGLLCPKCHNRVRAKSEAQPEKKRRGDGSDGIYVTGSSAKDSYSKIARTCPQCGNSLVFHWFSDALGEHAGVRQERTVEHFRCTKCTYSWTE